MKRIRVNLDNISDFDLQLAKNPRVIAMLDEIIPCSLDQRAQDLKTLQQKIERGETNLFEEHVQSRLLEHRNAEWIRVIHKNLPAIEQEIQKRQPSQNPSLSDNMPSSQEIQSQSPPRRQARQTHSELLDFLATQTPPKPPTPSSVRNKPVKDKAKSAMFSGKELMTAGLLLLVLASSIGFVTFSKDESPEALQTFREQNLKDSPEARQARIQNEKTQADFDAASQELRFGDFERGKAQLFHLVESSPKSIYAENAYVLIADTARLRKHDPDLALQTYQAFLEKWPESSQAGLVQLKMGFSYEDLEDFSNAESAYRLLIANAGEKSRLGQLARERLLRLKEQDL